MKVFTCIGFEGHWPESTAAVVVAKSAEDAASILEGALAARGLIQRIEPTDLKEVDTTRASADVLCDGDY